MQLYLGDETRRLKLYIDLLPYERKSFIAIENIKTALAIK